MDDEFDDIHLLSCHSFKGLILFGELRISGFGIRESGIGDRISGVLFVCLRFLDFAL